MTTSWLLLAQSIDGRHLRRAQRRKQRRDEHCGEEGDRAEHQRSGSPGAMPSELHPYEPRGLVVGGNCWKRGIASTDFLRARGNDGTSRDSSLLAFQDETHLDISSPHPVDGVVHPRERHDIDHSRDAMARREREHLVRLRPATDVISVD